MRILFDHGTPAPLRHGLADHEVSTAREMGWDELDNGALIAAAEKHFEVLITTDQSIRYQQNLTSRKLAILVLPTTSWPKIKFHRAAIINAVAALGPGEFVELNFKMD